MSANWNNLYSGGKTGIHIASDNPDEVCRLVESLLETISAHEGAITRTGILEAMAIAESVLSSLENPGKTDDMFSGGDCHDINSSSSNAGRDSKALSL